MRSPPLHRRPQRAERPERFVTPQIVPRRSRSYYPLLFLPVVMLWLFSTWMAYDYGGEQAGFDRSKAGEQLSALRSQIRTQNREKEQWLRTLTRQETDLKVFKSAEVALRGELKSAQQQLVEQEKKLVFLRAVASGKLKKSLLTISNLEVFVLPEKGGYQLSLAVGQAMAAKPKIQGNMVIHLLAVDASGESRAIPIAQLVEGEPDLGMSFQNVQKFEFRFRLPQGIKPVQWEVRLQPSTENVAGLKERFDWKLARQG